MKYIYVGKIVNTFGIKGELKIVSHFEMPEKVFVKGKFLKILNNEYEITNVRYHKNNYLIELNNIKDINEVEYLKGADCLFNKDCLQLESDEYLLSELIGYNVYDEEELIGKVTDYDNNVINPLIKINNSFYIPVKGNFIIKVDKEHEIIKAQNLKGLML